MADGPIVGIPRTDKSITWQREMDRLRALKSEKKDFELWKKDITIPIRTDTMPFFFMCPLSDIHLGAYGTDYDAINYYRQSIIDYPIYTTILGDSADFFNPKILAHAMMGDAENPDEQMESMTAFLGGGFAEKVLGMVNGNHEDFATNSSGIVPMRWVNKEFNIPLLQAGSVMTLKVNDINYRLGLWHKLTNNSAINRTHAGKVALKNSSTKLDMVISGDKHMGAMEQFVFGDDVASILQMGTFKTEDAWGREMGMTPPPQVFFPVLMFDANSKNITMIRSLETAKSIIDAFGEGFKKKRYRNARISKGRGRVINGKKTKSYKSSEQPKARRSSVLSRKILSRRRTSTKH